LVADRPAHRPHGPRLDGAWRGPGARTRSAPARDRVRPASRVEPDLAEWDYGDYEGLRSSEIQAIRPDWNVWRDGCPHGETPAQLGHRVDGLIGRLGGLRGNVALFAHGQLGAALAVRWIALALSAGQHFALWPASLSVLGHEANHPQRRVIQLWNEVAVSAPAY